MINLVAIDMSNHRIPSQVDTIVQIARKEDDAVIKDHGPVTALNPGIWARRRAFMLEMRLGLEDFDQVFVTLSLV